MKITLKPAVRIACILLVASCGNSQKPGPESIDSSANANPYRSQDGDKSTMPADSMDGMKRDNMRNNDTGMPRR